MHSRNDFHRIVFSVIGLTAYLARGEVLQQLPCPIYQGMYQYARESNHRLCININTQMVISFPDIVVPAI